MKTKCPFDIELHREIWEQGYSEGYKQAKMNIISLIEIHISEIIGDAQPKPILRTELTELLNEVEKS